MKKLLKKIEDVKKSEIKNLISKKVQEFENILIKKDKDKIFSELCFCLLTANYQAEKCIQLQKELENKFHKENQGTLAKILKEKGHRFWPQRAERIVLARKNKEELYKLISKNTPEREIRNWLVKNIKGLGMKESSHFLRNIGYKNMAIIDFHIIDLLKKEGLIEKPKTITPKKYLEIEKTLGDIAKKANLTQGELDLYLWYLETGKVLK